MEMCSGSPSACLDSCSVTVDFGAKRTACRLALKPDCLAQGASAWDTGSDGWVLRAVGLPRMFSSFSMHVSILSSLPSGKSQCVEGGVIFTAWWSRQCACKLSILSPTFFGEPVKIILSFLRISCLVTSSWLWNHWSRVGKITRQDTTERICQRLEISRKNKIPVPIILSHSKITNSN